MIRPEQMIVGNYYVFDTYDIDSIPSKVFGKFVGIKHDGNYLFNKVVVNADANVALMHGIDFRHPNYNVRGRVEIWPHNMRRIELVPGGAVLFIYSLLQAEQNIDSESIEQLVDRLEHEPAEVLPPPSSLRPATATRNSFDGGRKRKSRKQRRR
jgi:hypothetical protein